MYYLLSVNNTNLSAKELVLVRKTWTSRASHGSTARARTRARCRLPLRLRSFRLVECCYFFRSKVASVSEWRARSGTVSGYFVLDPAPPLSDTPVLLK